MMNRDILPVELSDQQLKAVTGGADPTVNVAPPTVNVATAINVPVQVVTVAASTLNNSNVDATLVSGSTAKAKTLLGYANNA
ncbi:MAG: hypothetical protein JO202_18255 [Ktedonobacteraceae bacterium]|nr:hypothetical protein [Ktedonobacteraceae bacterium]